MQLLPVCPLLLPAERIEIREIGEYKVFKALLELVPGLQARLTDEEHTSAQDVIHITDMVS